eukprot:TRINITY_DN159440_c0_g1_i1.p3 TRINITY_DN159440_c0_g1~~TRINITY_DN159440_c0_g1_i1.p3  ORF type:complete len:112 (-),score=10.56 TRINITY_DN159440_c0_g1_i1:193-486(-)
MEPGELKEMMKKIRDIEQAMGSGSKSGPRPEELEMAEKGRRSLHAKVKINEGQKITDSMLCVKRPGLGIPPLHRDQVIGRTAQRDIAEDEWITWEMI